MPKISLYFHTLKSMKPSQVYYRLKKMAGLNCALGCSVRNFDINDICPIKPVSLLDYDETFLARFSSDEILQDKVTFLYCTRNFQWNEKWECEDRTPLWNFNLHYFEYLFPLIDSYRKTGNIAYFEKTKQCILSWIQRNPIQEGGTGWSSYTIALRLIVWLEYYSEMETEIKDDEVFYEKFLASVYEQYVYLSTHLEKYLLGNHYFEDLKTLVLCALFFHDDKYLQCVLKEFKQQCKEQILADGMHFELSPMYHKIILEDMMRVAWALRQTGNADEEIESYLQPMLDVAYSLEEGLERVPLFNDGGNNVSKSLEALIQAAEEYFNITPHYNNQFPVSGYYIFKQGEWKLIVDAGEPGPAYIPGHAHCDMMSFELFKDKTPEIVNCGTFAYQCKERAFFRGTSAHNTVMIDGKEQSQCWGAFRMAKRSHIKVLEQSEMGIKMEMIDQRKNRVKRTISFDGEELRIKDECKNHKLSAFYHFVPEFANAEIIFGGGYNLKDIAESCSKVDDYAEDFGKRKLVKTLCVEAKDALEVRIKLGSVCNSN